jgi:hypothetical protein
MSGKTGQKLTEDLPYVFDLLWDIKRRRRLYETVVDHIGITESKLDSMCDLNIELTETEALVLDVVMDDLIRTYRRYKGE